LRIGENIETSINIEKLDILAIKAVARGDAGEVEQKRAIKYILEVIGAKDINSYVKGDIEATHILLGRQFVGQTISAIIDKKFVYVKQEEPKEIFKKGKKTW